jgi:hypothetical protein
MTAIIAPPSHSEASSAQAWQVTPALAQQRPADRVEAVDQQRARGRRIRVAAPAPHVVATRAHDRPWTPVQD